jgi:hypothetical protein
MGAFFSSIRTGVSSAASSVGTSGGSSISAFVISVILLMFGGLVAGNVIPIDESIKGSVSVALIIVGGIVLVVSITLGYSKTAGVPVIAPSTDTAVDSFFRLFPPVTGSISNGFRILYYFLPYILFTLGFFIDIVTAKVQFLPAGITALLTCVANYIASSSIYGFTTDRDMCGIPGLSALGSRLLPQSALFNLTALAHMASYITIKQGFFGVNKIAPAWGLFGAVAILQGLVMSSTGCFESTGIGIFKIIMSAGIAAGLGYAGAYVTSKNISDPGSQGVVLPATPGTPGTPPLDAGTCSAPNDQDQFVCEAYKNGQLVTSTIVG